jgi:hypothetical protein
VGPLQAVWDWVTGRGGLREELGCRSRELARLHTIHENLKTKLEELVAARDVSSQQGDRAKIEVDRLEGLAAAREVKVTKLEAELQEIRFMGYLGLGRKEEVETRKQRKAELKAILKNVELAEYQTMGRGQRRKGKEINQTIMLAKNPANVIVEKAVTVRRCPTVSISFVGQCPTVSDSVRLIRRTTSLFSHAGVASIAESGEGECTREVGAGEEATREGEGTGEAEGTGEDGRRSKRRKMSSKITAIDYY